jgi:hypothetical protein
MFRRILNTRALCAGLATAVLFAASLNTIAGETMAVTGKETEAVEETEEKVVSGVLNLDLNTHFISYGQDVWAAGAAWDDPLFNPSLELTIALGGNFNFILGTWWDVNDNADSSIGDAIQEIDVWAGFSYIAGPVTFKLLYQEWLFASDSERIVDFIVAVDTLLNPSLTVHGRVDGNGPQEEGVVFVLGIAEGFEAGPFTFNFPLNVAFATDEYHGGDAGFAYVSVGATASVPVPFLPGDWSAHAGVTYYHTDSGVIPTNPDEDFVTGNIGLTLAF